jgi:predicted secreted hydrolase
MPHLDATGSVIIDGREVTVAGSAWLDREWSTSALSPGVAGWDWFALQLQDGGSLMFYRLRLIDGGISEFSAGTLIAADGERLPLAATDVELTATRYWRSAASGVTYPVAWRLEIPKVGIALEVQPYLLEQEVDLSVRYWEGAVFARDARSGTLKAQGYLELTGY